MLWSKFTKYKNPTCSCLILNEVPNEVGEMTLKLYLYSGNKKATY